MQRGEVGLIKNPAAKLGEMELCAGRDSNVLSWSGSVSPHHPNTSYLRVVSSPNSTTMNAKQLIQKFGNKLLGQKVNTPALGEYPGGIATVIEIAPDENAPEIVFQVSLPGWGEIGVFEHEEISVQQQKKGKQ